MRSLAAQGRVLFTATLLLAAGARASDTVRIPDGLPEDRSLIIDEPPTRSPLPTQTSHSSPGGPDESQVIRDPLPPAVWSGGSMFALGGAVAAWRRFRRKLR